MPKNNSDMTGKPWSKDIDEIFSDLKSDPENGLDENDVKERRKKYGRNKLKESKNKSGWEIFIDQFNSMIVYVLLAAVVLSFIFDQNLEGFAILAVVIVNAVVGYITDDNSDSFFAVCSGV